MWNVWLLFIVTEYFLRPTPSNRAVSVTCVIVSIPNLMILVSFHALFMHFAQAVSFRSSTSSCSIIRTTSGPSWRQSDRNTRWMNTSSRVWMRAHLRPEHVIMCSNQNCIRGKTLKESSNRDECSGHASIFSVGTMFTILAMTMPIGPTLVLIFIIRHMVIPGRIKKELAPLQVLKKLTAHSVMMSGRTAQMHNTLTRVSRW